MSDKPRVLTDAYGPVFVVTINSIEARNAVDGVAASALLEPFITFEARNDLKVAVLTGTGGAFCAGLTSKQLGRRGRTILSPRARPMVPLDPLGFRSISPLLQLYRGMRLRGVLSLPVGAIFVLPMRQLSLTFFVVAGFCH